MIQHFVIKFKLPDDTDQDQTDEMISGLQDQIWDTMMLSDDLGKFFMDVWSD